MKKDVVVGIGEIGKPILKLLSKGGIVVGFDLNHDLMDQIKFEKYKNLKTSFLHIAIPGTDNLIDNVLKLYKKFLPECIIIHSTIKPGTTEKLQKKIPIPVIYSIDKICKIIPDQWYIKWNKNNSNCYSNCYDCR